MCVHIAGGVCTQQEVCAHSRRCVHTAGGVCTEQQVCSLRCEGICRQGAEDALCRVSYSDIRCAPCDVPVVRCGNGGSLPIATPPLPPSLPASLCSFVPTQEGISPNKIGSSSGPPRSQGRRATPCVPRSPARGSEPASPRAPGSRPSVPSTSVRPALRLGPLCTLTWTDSL